MKLARRISLVIVATALAAASLSTPLHAIRDKRFFINNDILFHDDSCAPASSAVAVILAGDDNEQKILNFFMQKGLSLAQAAGIVGNLQVESGLKPNIREGGRLVDDTYTPENGVGFGLAQWTWTGRQKPLVDFTKQMGVPVTDLGGQLGFIWHELEGPYLPALNKLRSTQDPAEAAVVFHNDYEKSAQSPAQVRATRGVYAQKIYDKYKDAPALAGAGAPDHLRNPGGSPDTIQTAGIRHSRPVVIGDSIAHGYATRQGHDTSLTSIGGSPRAILDRINNARDLNDAQTIYLSTGLSNDPHDKQSVHAMLRTLTGKTKARIIVMGVANNYNLHDHRGGELNDFLKKATAQHQNVSFTGGFTAGDDGVHPANYEWVPESATNQPANKQANNSCQTSFEGGDFKQTLLAYAWSDWRGTTIEAREEYTSAVSQARGEGRYIGGTNHPGIDCGGFTTLLITNSGFDKGFNYDGKGGNTPIQEKWMKDNWEYLGNSSSIDPNTLQPGDVAVNAAHTFVYVGEVDGFGAKIASASWDERAPMADPHQQPTEAGFNWYRKKASQHESLASV